MPSIKIFLTGMFSLLMIANVVQSCQSKKVQLAHQLKIARDSIKAIDGGLDKIMSVRQSQIDRDQERLPQNKEFVSYDTLTSHERLFYEKRLKWRMVVDSLTSELKKL